jgi:hypothetical protein
MQFEIVPRFTPLSQSIEGLFLSPDRIGIVGDDGWPFCVSAGGLHSAFVGAVLAPDLLAIVEGGLHLLGDLELDLRLAVDLFAGIVGQFQRFNGQFFALEHHMIVVVRSSQVFL